MIGKGEFVSGLAHGLSVIGAFDADNPQMTLSEIARKTDLSPATARRSLHTLMSLGYVHFVNKRFLLAPKVLTLGGSYLRSAHIEESFLPELRRIVSLFGDASSIGVLSGTDVLYIAHYSEQKSLRPTAATGATYPAYATSMGRVLLSGLSDEAVADYCRVAQLEKLTEDTETDPKRLTSLIRDVRRSGYATTRDQLAYGITALAVPVRIGSSRIIATINTSGYSGRTTPDELVAERLEELQVSAMRITDTLVRYPALRHSLEQETPKFGPAEPLPRKAAKADDAVTPKSARASVASGD